MDHETRVLAQRQGEHVYNVIKVVTKATGLFEEDQYNNVKGALLEVMYDPKFKGNLPKPWEPSLECYLCCFYEIRLEQRTPRREESTVAPRTVFWESHAPTIYDGLAKAHHLIDTLTLTVPLQVGVDPCFLRRNQYNGEPPLLPRSAPIHFTSIP